MCSPLWLLVSVMISSASASCCSERWWPLFKASPLLYSEFPEHQKALEGRAARRHYSRESEENYVNYNGYTDYSEDNDLESGKGFEDSSEEIGTKEEAEVEELPKPGVEEDEVNEEEEEEEGVGKEESVEEEGKIPVEEDLHDIRPVKESIEDDTPIEIVQEDPIEALPVKEIEIEEAPRLNNEDWKKLISLKEVEGLQEMRPPPLGQFQTWTVTRRPRKKFLPRPRTRVYVW